MTTSAAAYTSLPRDEGLLLGTVVVGAGLREEVAELLDGRSIREEIELLAPIDHEDAAAGDLGDRIFGAAEIFFVVVAGIMFVEREPAIRPDLDERCLGNGMEVDQRAVRSEGAFGSPPGHGPCPRAPFSTRTTTGARCRTMKADERQRSPRRRRGGTRPPSQGIGDAVLGPLDPVHERIDGRDTSRPVRIAPRQAPVATADLEHLGRRSDPVRLARAADRRPSRISRQSS